MSPASCPAAGQGQAEGRTAKDTSWNFINFESGNPSYNRRTWGTALMQTCRIFVVIFCWFLVFATCSLAQKNIKKTLTVRSVSYRAVPWENTTYYRTQGHSATDCYGSGTDYGYGSAVTVNCTTTTAPSQTYPITISKMFVYTLQDVASAFSKTFGNQIDVLETMETEAAA